MSAPVLANSRRLLMVASRRSSASRATVAVSTNHNVPLMRTAPTRNSVIFENAPPSSAPSEIGTSINSILNAWAAAWRRASPLRCRCYGASGESMAASALFNGYRW